MNCIKMMHINCLSYTLEITTTCVINAPTDHVQIESSPVCGNKFISLDINATLFV